MHYVKTGSGREAMRVRHVVEPSSGSAEATMTIMRITLLVPDLPNDLSHLLFSPPLTLTHALGTEG